MQFYFCYPNTEIHGEALLSIIDAIDPACARRYLVKHGLVCIEPDKWYSAQIVLNFIKDVSQEFAGEHDIPTEFREILAFREWLCRLFPVRYSATGNLRFAV